MCEKNRCFDTYHQNLIWKHAQNNTEKSPPAIRLEPIPFKKNVWTITSTLHAALQFIYQFTLIVTESCVDYALKLKRPRIWKVSERKQRCHDPDCNWNQAKQSLVCPAICLLTFVGLIAFMDLLKKMHDPDIVVRRLDIHQIVWWDETHQKCHLDKHTPTNGLSSLNSLEIKVESLTFYMAPWPRSGHCKTCKFRWNAVLLV